MFRNNSVSSYETPVKPTLPSRPPNTYHHERSKSDFGFWADKNQKDPFVTPVKAAPKGGVENSVGKIGWIKWSSRRTQSSDTTTTFFRGRSLTDASSKIPQFQGSPLVERKDSVVFLDRPPANEEIKPLWPPKPEPTHLLAETKPCKDKPDRHFFRERRPELATATTWPALPQDWNGGIVESPITPFKSPSASSIATTPPFSSPVTPSPALIPDLPLSARRRVSYMPMSGKLFEDPKSPIIPSPKPKGQQAYLPRPMKIARRFDSRFCDGCLSYITFDPKQYECEGRRNSLEEDHGPGCDVRLCESCMYLAEADGYSGGFFSKGHVGDGIKADVNGLRTLHSTMDGLSIKYVKPVMPKQNKTKKESDTAFSLAKVAVKNIAIYRETAPPSDGSNNDSGFIDSEHYEAEHEEEEEEGEGEFGDSDSGQGDSSKKRRNSLWWLSSMTDGACIEYKPMIEQRPKGRLTRKERAFATTPWAGFKHHRTWRE